MRDTSDSDLAVTKDRRPLKTRSWWIFRRLASLLADLGVTPNSISVASIVFAAIGAIGFFLTGLSNDSWVMRCGWSLAIVGIQLRLIANLLDGMVAVEGGKASATGPLYNEVPDRLSDSILLIAAGYSYSGEPVAGWAAAMIALLVAYSRAIAASVGAGQLFSGPMAKPQRMAILTFVAGLGLFLPGNWLMIYKQTDHRIGLVQIALWIIVGGGVITFFRRLRAAARFLRDPGKQTT